MIKSNINMPAKKLAKMIGGRHSWKGVYALKIRIKKGLV
jgi:hypothetical protein